MVMGSGEAKQRPMVRVMRPRTPDPRHAHILVDANFFQDSIAIEERAAADALLQLSEDNVLTLIAPHSVARELEHPSTPRTAKERFARVPYSIETENENDLLFERIHEAFRGNSRPDKHVMDAKHLRNASKWMASYFVTCDDRFFKRQDAIYREIWGLTIVKPTELLERVEKVRTSS